MNHQIIGSVTVAVLKFPVVGWGGVVSLMYFLSCVIISNSFKYFSSFMDKREKFNQKYWDRANTGVYGQ